MDSVVISVLHKRTHNHISKSKLSSSVSFLLLEWDHAGHRHVSDLIALERVSLKLLSKIGKASMQLEVSCTQLLVNLS